MSYFPAGELWSATPADRAAFHENASMQQLREIQRQYQSWRLRVSKTMIYARCRLQFLLFHFVVGAPRRRYRVAEAWDLFPNTPGATRGHGLEPGSSRVASSALVREFPTHPHLETT